MGVVQGLASRTFKVTISGRGARATNTRGPSGGCDNIYTPRWIDLRVQITKIFA